MAARYKKNKNACQCQMELTELKAEMMRMKQQMSVLQKAVNGSRAEISDKLQKKGGSGHFYGKDQRVREGGPRDEMKAGDVQQILKLLSLGQEKVNFKFWMAEPVNVEAYGWKLYFSICFPKSFGSTPGWVFTFGIKEIACMEYTNFKAVIEIIEEDSGAIIFAEDLLANGSEIKFKKCDLNPCDYYVRFNVTIL